MRKTQLMLSLLMATSLFAATAFAEQAAQQATEPATNKLESINPAPSAESNEDCPMLNGQKKKCDPAKEHVKDCPMHSVEKDKDEHKNGEPCPYHKEGKQKGMSHEKCDHKHPA